MVVGSAPSEITGESTKQYSRQTPVFFGGELHSRQWARPRASDASTAARRRGTREHCFPLPVRNIHPDSRRASTLFSRARRGRCIRASIADRRPSPSGLSSARRVRSIPTASPRAGTARTKELINLRTHANTADKRHPPCARLSPPPAPSTRTGLPRAVIPLQDKGI